MLVSVIIVNWNGRQYLPGCLDSLRRQTLRDFEVIVVDNASTDDSNALLRDLYPEVRLLVNDSNLGFAAGNNVGIAAAQGELIALLNNDTEAHEDWLSELVTALDADNRIAGCCGKTFALEERDKLIFTLPKIDHRSARAVWINQDAPQMLVDYLAGSCMLVRRRVIDEIGLLDGNYFAYYEETDWCARMIRAGYDLLYVPTAIVWHKAFGSGSLDFNFFMMQRNRIRFALKNFDSAFLAAFAVLYLRDAFRTFIQNSRTGARHRNRLLLSAIWWNVSHLAATLRARRRDLRLANRRSYNLSLPLRAIVDDGRGGFRPVSASR